MYQNRLLIRMLVFFSCFLSGANVFADDDPVLPKEKPQRIEVYKEIKHIGKNILLANRAYKEAEEITLLRKQLEVVHNSIAMLTQPVVGTVIGKIIINSGAVKSTNKPSVTSISNWQNAHATEITKFKAEHEKLRNLCIQLRNKRESVKPGFFKKLLMFIVGEKQKKNTIFKNPVISDEMLAKIEDINNEVNKALVMEEGERQKRLKEIDASIVLTKKTDDQDKNVSHTPTFIVKTKHRSQIGTE